MPNTKIEVVRLFRFENGGPVKAFCDVQFDDNYIIKGFRVVEGKAGLFVGMPREAGKSGKWFDTFLPLSDEMKSHIQETLIAAYQE